MQQMPPSDPLPTMFSDYKANKAPFKYGPITAAEEAFVRRLDYKGRSTRAAFWWALCLLIPLLLLLLSGISLIHILTEHFPISDIISELIFNGTILCFLIIVFSLSIRRFHDIGLSGWLCGANFILSTVFIFYTKSFSDYFDAYTLDLESLMILPLYYPYLILLFINSDKDSNKWGPITNYFYIIPATPPAESAVKYGFISALKEAFARRWDFKGRSTRAAYWWVMPLLVTLLIPLLIPQLLFIELVKEGILGILSDDSFFDSFQEIEAGGIMNLSIFTFVFLITSIGLYYIAITALSLSVRRVHDVGFSGWLIAVVGISYLLHLLQKLYISISYCLLDEPMILSKSPYPITEIICGIIFFLSFIDSKRGSNKWGPSPKYSEESAKSIQRPS